MPEKHNRRHLAPNGLTLQTTAGDGSNCIDDDTNGDATKVDANSGANGDNSSGSCNYSDSDNDDDTDGVANDNKSKAGKAARAIATGVLSAIATMRATDQVNYRPNQT